MPRGADKHMKRINAPYRWFSGKTGGVFCARPQPGPHKLLNCIPLLLLLRNRLKYALTYKEAMMICKQKLVNIDGKARTDIRYPAGFQDVIEIDDTKDRFRILFDPKGRFTLVKISPEDAKFKLCKVQKKSVTRNAIPVIATHDGRTVRYPDPNIKEGDSVEIELATGKIRAFHRFHIGNVAMVTGGANTGRVGEIMDIERHPGAFDIIHLKDKAEQTFATRSHNVFVMGSGDKPAVTLPKAGGVLVEVHIDRDKKIQEYKKRKEGGKKGKKH
jgi:small subunit ribosomal protein S4e